MEQKSIENKFIPSISKLQGIVSNFLLTVSSRSIFKAMSRVLFPAYLYHCQFLILKVFCLIFQNSCRAFAQGFLFGTVIYVCICTIATIAFSINYLLLFFISDTFGERIYSKTFLKIQYEN